MSNERISGTATSDYSEEVTPESMMNEFRGRPFVGILTFTVIVHVVFVSVFSFGYLKSELFGEDTSSLAEEKRLEIAVREATTSLREIAERHSLNPQDLTSQFARGATRPATSATSLPTTDPGPETPGESAGTESAIEKELNTKVKGPAAPDLPPDLPTEEEDLF